MLHNAKEIAPGWATRAVHIEEISDTFIEECDPENELGAICIAYFERNKYGHLLIAGVSVEDDQGRAYLGRDWCETCIGFEAINRNEDIAEQSAFDAQTWGAA